MTTNERKGLRGTVLCEDKRTEKFVRNLLKHFGYDLRAFKFAIAPHGKGAAEAWVQNEYPDAVRVLRRKRHQRLCLIAIRDGDSVGVIARKRELDDALRKADLDARTDDERIAVPVPTWSIETWLLALLGGDDIDERQSLKAIFERKYDSSAIREAIRAWPQVDSLGLPSLVDGQDEMSRIAR